MSTQRRPDLRMNLAKAGHKLAVYNRTPGKTAALEAAGAHPNTSRTVGVAGAGCSSPERTRRRNRRSDRAGGRRVRLCRGIRRGTGVGVGRPPERPGSALTLRKQCRESFSQHTIASAFAF